MRKLPILFALTLVFVSSSFAQTTDGWMRVQTDDGAFSVEVPERHKYFFSKDGFVVSWETGEYLTENMSMLTAFSNKTLLSIETYDAIPAVLDRLRELDATRAGSALALSDGPDERIGKTKVKTQSRKDNDAHVIAKYLRAGKQIVVLLAATRSGRTPEMDRFFSSVQVKSGDDAAAAGTPFSQLVKSDVTMAEKIEDKKPNPPITPITPKKEIDPTLSRMVVVRTTPASYVPKARAQGVKGSILLRVYFGADGFVNHIDVNKKLSGGLLRQTLYSAIRIRYLPEEKSGVPVNVSRPVTFSFKIY